MDFNAIFAEYYTLYRGQATNIPVYGDREYAIAIRLANNSIKKWARVDGTLWRELISTFQTESPGTVIASSTHSYAIVNMRKPPAFIQFGTSSNLSRYPVIGPEQIENYTNLDGIAYFVGSANKGYTLNLPGSLTAVNGQLIDFIFYKKATQLSTSANPGATLIEMSDPNFMIQDMLASRFSQSRNGFGYKVAKAEANAALLNMKVDNNSGTYGAASNLGSSGSGWGVTEVNDGLGKI